MKGYRTILAAVLLGVGGFLEAFEWAEVVGEDYDGLMLLVIGIVMAGLRAVTNTPLGQK